MSDQNTSLPMRNLLRGEIRSIAQSMRDGDLDLSGATQALEDLANKDEDQLDADDIIVDFEAGKAMQPGPIFAMMASVQNGKQVSTGDPVDIALLQTIALRDKISAQRIVGEVIPDAEQEEYRNSLSNLHGILSNFVSKQD